MKSKFCSLLVASLVMSSLTVPVAQLNLNAQPAGRVVRGSLPGTALAPQLLSQGDKKGDQKLTKEEFTALADAWFDKLDVEKTGKLSQEQFVRDGRLARLADSYWPAHEASVQEFVVQQAVAPMLASPASPKLDPTAL